MALRDVLIKLRLDTSQYKTAMAAAAANTKAFAGETAAAGAKSGKSLGLLAGAYGTIGLAAGAATVAAVRAGAEFQQAMANVRSTGAASEAQMHDLRDAALEMGKTTVYSSTEAAGGMEALLKAGLSANDVIGGGLTGSFNLAAAGGLEVAEAAETAASAMAQFSLSGKDVPHIADLLAAGAGKANGDVRDLGQALNQAGLIAAGAGASIEETTGTLAAFAKAGLLGSDAGTSFKTMLQRLQKPTADSQALLDKYHISAYDVNGDFVGLAKIAGELQTGLSGLTQEQRNAALATIFGSDAVRAANVLYKEGQAGINDWTTKVNDAGYAADVAAIKTDTLKGDLDKMKNSWRALAEGGGGGDGPGLFRPFIQGLDELADGLGKAADKLGDFGLRYGSLRDLIIAHNLDLSYDVVAKFKTEGSANAIRDAARVASAEGMSDRTVTALLEQKGWSTEGIDLVLARLHQVDATKAEATLALQMGMTVEQLRDFQAQLDGVDATNPTSKVDLENLTPSQKRLAIFFGLLKDVDKTNPTSKVTVETSEAERNIKRVLGLLDDLPSSGKTGGIDVLLTPAAGGAIEGFSWGGHARGAIRGPGTATSDSIPARLSNGEHVLTASDVHKMGGQDAVYAMRRAIQSGAYAQPARAYAAGGAVRSIPTSVRSVISLEIRDVTMNVERSAMSMRVVAKDELDRVLAESNFEAGL